MIKKVVGSYSTIRSSNFCKCPMHHDLQGVMYVDEWNDIALCPICNKSWTPTSFVADKERLPYYEAYAQIYWVQEWDWKEQYREVSRISKFYRSAYHWSDGEKYMESRWVDNTLADFYELGWNDKERRVVFPIKNIYWVAVWFTARAIDDWVQPKYKNSKNSPIFQKKRLLYWFDPDFIYDSYVLVEGQMDVIKLQSIWYSNAVCSSWTAINRDQLILLPKVTVLYDSDEAWQKATERVVEMCKSLSIPCTVITIPWKDADEFISSGWDMSEYIPYETGITKRENKNRELYLSAYALIDEGTIENSVISKSWVKIANNSTLWWYLSNIFVDVIRYTIQKELRFRKGGDDRLEVDFDQLKNTIPIEMVIESYGIQIPSGRANIPCPLPDHKDGTPSFSINKPHNLFKCFWCNKWWSQIDFIKEMEKCDTMTAINKFKSFL